MSRIVWGSRKRLPTGFLLEVREGGKEGGRQGGRGGREGREGCKDMSSQEQRGEKLKLREGADEGREVDKII